MSEFIPYLALIISLILMPILIRRYLRERYLLNHLWDKHDHDQH